MKYSARTCGNLALAPEPATRFDVIDGYGSHKIVAPARVQLFSPSVHASSRAPRKSAANARGLLIAVASAVVAISFVFAFIGEYGDAPLSQAMEHTPSRVHVVSSGDSLWQIAQRNTVPGLSTEETVELIRRWNDLDSALLSPGMELFIPNPTS